MPTQLDPYAPHPQPERVEIKVVVPAARLHRLGAGSLNVYRDWWESLDQAGQEQATAALAVLTDDQLRDIILFIDGYSTHNVKAIEKWVRSQPSRQLVTQLALAAEGRRFDGPREGLVKRLGALS